MIKTRYLNDGTLIQHYSNKGYLLLQNETGIKYFNPIDAKTNHEFYYKLALILGKSQ